MIDKRRHPQAIAWDKFMNTHGHLADPHSCLANNREFLANRLAVSFQEGWSAAERHYEAMAVAIKQPKQK